MLRIIFCISVFSCLLSNSIYAQNPPHFHFYTLVNQYGDTSYISPKSSLLRSEEISLTEEHLALISKIEVLILQVDLVVNNPLLEPAKYNHMEEGYSLSDFLSTNDLRTIDSLLVATVGLGLVSPVNRWMPIEFERLLIKELFDNSPFAYDYTLIKRAQASDIEVVGLEDYYQVYKNYSPSTYPQQAERVKGLLNHDAFWIDHFTNNREAFLAGNFQAILDAEKGSWGDQQIELLVYQKNKRWARSIAKTFEKTPFFLCVDAIHLPGEYGMLKLFKGYGFTILE